MPLAVPLFIDVQAAIFKTTSGPAVSMNGSRILMPSLRPGLGNHPVQINVSTISVTTGIHRDD